MHLARKFRIRAPSVQAAMARLEVVARCNPGKAPEIIASIRKVERVALFVERYATGISKREQQSGSGSANPFRSGKLEVTTAAMRNGIANIPAAQSGLQAATGGWSK